ncbi:hypothetical protein BX600DRAFT_56264 [Xylariales sp. PMI_506]|nr:hypothetical protein BX600DRAFT_56264 [Xylariales sp. PMI_506]
MATVNMDNAVPDPPPKDEAPTAQHGLGMAADIQTEILEQLKILVQLQQQTISKPPIVTEFIWNTLLQVLGLIAAALFGAFSVLAWQVSQAANGMASAANDLAMQANSLGSQGNNLAAKSNCLGGVSNWLSIIAYCQNLL